MNSASGKVENFIFVSQTLDCERDIYEMCLRCIKADRTVVLISRKPIDMLSLATRLKVNNHQLKQFIVMYSLRIEDVVQKLLELHDWKVLPHLVVLNLNDYFQDDGKVTPSSGEQSPQTSMVAPTLQSLCLCVATLFNYMTSVERRLPTCNLENAVAHSVTLLGEHGQALTKSQLELMINLYFYNESAFDDFNELQTRIISQRQ